MQIEKVVMESQDVKREGIKLINRENLSFLNEVNLGELSSRDFNLYR